MHGYVPILRANNISNGMLSRDRPVYVPSEYVSEDQYLREGDLMIAASSGSKSSVGKAATAGPEHLGFAFGAFCMVARPHSQQAGAWLAAYFKTPEYRSYVERTSGGTNINNLKAGDLNEMIIPLCGFEEQKRILAKIDDLGARVERGRIALMTAMEQIDEFRRAVIAQAFVAPLSSGGDVWPQVALGEICDIQTGLTLGKKRKPTDELTACSYLRVANVQRGRLDLTDVKEMQATDSEIERLRLRKGDILLNEGGDRDKLGRGWVWGGEIEKCIHQNHVFRARLLDPSFPPEWVSHYANEFGQNYFFSEGQQTTNLASISKARLSAFPVPVPPADVARRRMKVVAAGLARAARLQASALETYGLVDKLERAILTKAFRGELIDQVPGGGTGESALAALRSSAIISEGWKREAKPKTKARRVKRSLFDVLKSTDDWITAQEALELCGVPSNALTEEVEPFYSQIRTLDKAKQIEVKPFRDASGRKLYDKLRLIRD
jgi:type I restriction enzyme S subunit